MVPQAPEEGWTAQMRLDPGMETSLKLLRLVKFNGGITQIDQETNGVIIACACFTLRALFDLPPIHLLVIVDLLQMTLASQSLLLTLLAFYSGPHGLAFGEQCGVSDLLTWFWRDSCLAQA